MKLQRIGAFAVPADRVRQVFPELRAGDRQAIADISLANRMTVRRIGQQPLKPRDPLRRAIQIDELTQ